MLARRTITSALVLPVVLIPASLPAVVVMPAEVVGAPFINLSNTCSIRIETPDGSQIGAEIPVKALHLGAPVTRGSISFGTGGSGTANAMEVIRRSRAGLQAFPRTFDVAGSARPEVFATGDGQIVGAATYQRLPLKTTSTAYGASSLAFARATSSVTGRIVSIQLTLETLPAAKPRVRIVIGDVSGNPRCSPPRELSIYAPAMTADHVRRLFSQTGCSWYSLAKCPRADRPRGAVLFVQSPRGGHLHRWIDYDALGRMQFTN